MKMLKTILGLTVCGSAAAFSTIALSPLRSSSPLFAAQTGDDFNGAESSRVRNAYMEWCRNYNKPYDEMRLNIFSENFLRMEKYAQQTGEQVKFNEYADLTTDEYRSMLLTQQQQRSIWSPPPNDWRRGIAETNPKGYETVMRLLAYVQTGFVGTVIGSLCVLPAQALHYLYLVDYSYTTYAQWEWDLLAAAIQGALFANVYRYAVRSDIDNETLANRLIWSFIIVKSLVRVTVTPDCAAYTWLYCAEPYYVMNDQMAATLAINFLESMALFIPVASIMKSLLRKGRIPFYDGYEA
mmetsp:Transcript_14201/g.40377  ORF Transcript_14201/g.40377 Transcript_14201/m.40377 type:complete len:296 (-) Transcript_14201:136-1023(-)